VVWICEVNARRGDPPVIHSQRSDARQHIPDPPKHTVAESREPRGSVCRHGVCGRNRNCRRR
jgi:hypothetical protein